ncbi:MAG: hypothetical protein NZ481_04655 [Candidatus Kapabacteria bacterium]|nr:hypothetical protein [Candidatus Kapabacteria bacterium]
MIRNRGNDLFVWSVAVLALWCSAGAASRDRDTPYPLSAAVFCDSLLSSYAAEWQTLTVTLVNHTDRAVRCAPRVTITKDGRILARTKIPADSLWTIPSQGTLEIGKDYLLERLSLMPDSRHQHPRWLPLADSGALTLCIHITDSLGIEYFAMPVCRTVRVFSYQLPILLGPNANDTLLLLSRKARVRFCWIPVLPQRRGTCYVVRCFALPDSLSIAEAVRVQTPLVERRVCDTAEFVWQPRMRLASGHYVWTVQALDHRTELPIGSSDGYSIPLTFVMHHLPKNVRAGRWVYHSKRRP